MTFSRFIWKWSWYSLVGHNPNLNGIEGFFLDGYKKRRIYDRVHHHTSKVSRDVDDTQ